MDHFIDAAVEQFAHDHTEPETDLYRRLREETYRVMSSPQLDIGNEQNLPTRNSFVNGTNLA